MKYILYSSIILFASCNKKTKSVAATTAAKADISKVIIYYEATACFGKCPCFSMTINGGTKTITYIGTHNVDRIGTFTKHFEADSILALVTAFDKAKYFDLEDKYLGQISDFPSQITAYTNYGKTKKIIDRQGAPPELREVETLLYTISKGNGWKENVPIEKD